MNDETMCWQLGRTGDALSLIPCWSNQSLPVFLADLNVLGHFANHPSHERASSLSALCVWIHISFVAMQLFGGLVEPITSSRKGFTDLSRFFYRRFNEPLLDKVTRVRVLFCFVQFQRTPFCWLKTNSELISDN